MTQRIRQSVIIFFLTNICLVLAVTSPAYIICPELILEKMIKAVGWPTGYVVKQHVSLDNSACDDFDGNAAILEETVWFKPPGKFRSETHVNDVKRAYIFAYDRALTIIDRQITSTNQNPLMVYRDLFVFRGRERLADRLLSLGVDMSVVSLGRFKETVAFVIGAKYPDKSASQLWVDKETFLPVRLLLRTKAQDSPVEVRYLDWRKEYRFQHPRRIEIYQNGRISRVICVRNIKDSFPESDSFFDVAMLQEKYPRIGSNKASAEPLDDKNEAIQQTIDDFKKLYQ